MAGSDLPGITADLRDHAGDLDSRAAQWRMRAADGASADQIKAAHAAVGLIDCMMRQLHEARSALITQLRTDEDERAARYEAGKCGAITTLPVLGDPVCFYQVGHRGLIGHSWESPARVRALPGISR